MLIEQLNAMLNLTKSVIRDLIASWSSVYLEEETQILILTQILRHSFTQTFLPTALQ